MASFPGSHNSGIEDYNRVTAPIIAFLIQPLPRNSGCLFGATTLARLLAAETFNAPGQLYHDHREWPKLNSPTGLRHAGFCIGSWVMIINVFRVLPIAKKWKSNGYPPQTRLPFFASDDLTAILIMKVARELDIQIPRVWKWLVMMEPSSSNLYTWTA